ncbi:MAG: hypothetical protein J7J06_05255 [Methanosarcinales archaeon]|nr:hypothetical protein [Methanosarcinales archaeon]
MMVVVLTHGYLNTGKVVKVTATIEEVTVGEHKIPDITDVDAGADRIRLISYPKDVPPNFPGVYVHVICASNRIEHWTSVPYTGPGTYNITAGLRFIPSDGTKVRVIVAVTDEKGNRIAMNTTDTVI